MPNKDCRTDCGHACCDYKTLDVGCRLYPDEDTGPASCRVCRDYLPRNMPSPAIVTAIRTEPLLPTYQDRLPAGAPVKLRLKTGSEFYVGFYAGDLPVQTRISWSDTVLSIEPDREPAFYVPVLGRLVFQDAAAQILYNSETPHVEAPDQDEYLNRLLQKVLE